MRATNNPDFCKRDGGLLMYTIERKIMIKIFYDSWTYICITTMWFYLILLFFLNLSQFAIYNANHINISAGDLLNKCGVLNQI